MTGNIWLFAGGTIAGIALSVWLCGVAEETIGKKDPGSVVLDERLCFGTPVHCPRSLTFSPPAPGR
jgi:phosphatidylglycerophosphatase A